VYLRCALLLALGWAGLCQAGARPNILLIVADDLGYNDLGSYAGAERYTPNLDQLAAAGTRFTRHYADSTCTASRAALLTGQYATRLGFQSSGRGLSIDTPNMASSLTGLGYRSWHIGKWHLGSIDRAAWPRQLGYDHFFGFIDQWQLAGKVDDNGKLIPARPRYQDPWLREDNKPPVKHPGHLTRILSDRAIEVIESPAEQPWFINLWYLAPHAPVQPAVAPAPVTGINTDYRLLVHQLDHHIGRVLRAVRDSGQWDNTVIVFVSDNGAKEAINNQPFSGAKATFLEGGVRTPLIIKPHGTTKPMRNNAVTSIRDIYPSLMELAGSNTRLALDGSSLAPLLRGQSRPATDLFWESFGYLTNEYSMLSADGNWRMHQRGRWTGIGNARLYHLALDPAGDTDVAGKHGPTLHALRRRYEEWHRQVNVVPLHPVQLDESGHGAYRGSSMMRSPGYGPYTFAIAWESSDERTADQYLAGQEDFWQLTWSPLNKQVTLQLASWKLQAAISNTHGCHSVMMSGDFLRVINNWSKYGDRFMVSLWSDGIRQSSLRDDGVVDHAYALVSPLLTGKDASEQQRLIGKISAPLILSTQVNANSIFRPLEIHETLCDQLQY
jgi:arylsulfatase A-like enzyme